MATHAIVSVCDGHASDRGKDPIAPNRRADLLSNHSVATDVVNGTGKFTDRDGRVVAKRNPMNGIVFSGSKSARQEDEVVISIAIVKAILGMLPAREAVPTDFDPVHVKALGVEVGLVLDSFHRLVDEISDVLNKGVDNDLGEDVESHVDLVAAAGVA